MIFGKKAEPAFQVLSISKPEMLLTMLNSTLLLSNHILFEREYKITSQP